jgi:hypothetical protein
MKSDSFDNQLFSQLLSPFGLSPLEKTPVPKDTQPQWHWFGAAVYWQWLWSTLAYILLGVSLPLLFWPEHLYTVTLGVILGVGYLFSLFLNAHFPMGNYQIVFSLTRMVLFAYLIVASGHFLGPEIGIVICGFFGYKLVLIVDMIGRSRVSSKAL